MSGLTKIRAHKTGRRDRDPGAGQTSDGKLWGQDEASQVPIPAHYIDRMSFESNGRLVAEAQLGPNVDANPLTAIRVENVLTRRQGGGQLDR